MSITSGSASDAIKQLLQTSYDRSNSLFGQSEGLSPQGMSALRTQATATIPNQYDSAARGLSTDLLRRGSIGQGSDPAVGGDIARTFQPLYTARAQATSKATTDMILANEKRKQDSLYQNNQLAQGALNSAGGFANDLADLEPASWKNLLLTSLLSNAGTSAGGGILGSLVSGGGLNGTGKGGLFGDLLGAAGLGKGNDLGGYTREPIDMGSDPLKTAENTGLTAGGLTGALQTVGHGVTGALGSLGHAAYALATNPITAVVGGVLLGAIAWTKSQAHWEANTWVNGFQQPFDQKMAAVHQQANQLKESGQMTPEAASQIQASAKEALDSYLQSLDTFYREKGTDSDQGKVAAQAYQTFLRYYGQGGQNYLNQLVA